MDFPKVSKNAGHILRKLRIKKGMSQTQLAKELGLNNSQHLWNMEHGTNSLTFDVIDKASRVLKVEVQEKS